MLLKRINTDADKEPEHFSPLYQIMYNVLRFASSKRLHPSSLKDSFVSTASTNPEEEAKKSVESPSVTDGNDEESKSALDTSTASMNMFFSDVYRNKVFKKFLCTLGQAKQCLVNQIMHAIVMERPWEVLAEPIKELIPSELC